MNHDLKTICKVIGTTVQDLNAGAVPIAMKRYITFIKVTNEYTSSNVIFICSGTTALNAASGIAKDRQGFWSQYDTIAYPDRPNAEAPLFSIAESKFLTAKTSNGNISLFLQYYDK